MDRDAERGACAWQLRAAGGHPPHGACAPVRASRPDAARRALQRRDAGAAGRPAADRVSVRRAALDIAAEASRHASAIRAQQRPSDGQSSEHVRRGARRPAAHRRRRDSEQLGAAAAAGRVAPVADGGPRDVRGARLDARLAALAVDRSPIPESAVADRRRAQAELQPARRHRSDHSPRPQPSAADPQRAGARRARLAHVLRRARLPPVHRRDASRAAQHANLHAVHSLSPKLTREHFHYRHTL